MAFLELFLLDFQTSLTDSLILLAQNIIDKVCLGSQTFLRELRLCFRIGSIKRCEAPVFLNELMQLAGCVDEVPPFNLIVADEL